MIDELNTAVLEALTPVCPACGLRYPECRNMRPVSYLPDAVAVEDEIDRLGLHDAYIHALIDEATPGAEEATHSLWYMVVADLWALIRATPEQRCRAALAIATRQETR